MRSSQAGCPEVTRWREFGKKAAMHCIMKPTWLISPRFGASTPYDWKIKIIRPVWD